MTAAFTCNSTCLVKAIRDENRYYAKSMELYGNVTELYPNSNIWLNGHSLGGSTSALLGLTFGLPVTTFEAPGDALAAARLGLPSPPDVHPSAPQTRKYTGAVHFGHTADPIFMGSCNAATSACTLGVIPCKLSVIPVVLLVTIPLRISSGVLEPDTTRFVASFMM